jgi:hypothetical protein
MRVCDGSCRRLARLQQQSPEHAALVQALDAQAAACAQAGHAEWTALMRRAAAALRDRAQTCCASSGEPPDA